MHSFPERYRQLHSEINARLDSVIDRDDPASMYTPARYVLDSGGKRIRPILVVLSCEAVGGRAEDAYDAGVAVEILHNFTLVHDDIMDHADQRRGRETVHRKWDVSTAILVGDELIGIAYKSLLKTGRGDLRALVSVFTDGMIEVCEGQSYDKEFEARPRVTEDEYMLMIGKKTGRLMSMSAELGAIIGGADDAQRAALHRFAEAVGRAFQIRDDLLDVVADEEEFGKTIGGDILEGKKTWLLVDALSRARERDLELLLGVSACNGPSDGLVDRVTDAYRRLGVLDRARERVTMHTGQAVEALQALPPGTGREMLSSFAGMLLDRTS